MKPISNMLSDRPHTVEESLPYLNENGANVAYVPRFLAPELLARLEFDSAEKSSVRRPFSKEKVPIPRLQTAYGDTGMSYRFSGVTVYARPWIPILLDLKEIITERSDFKPNFVLVNYYRSGNDYIGWHSDDEKDMGEFPEVVSLSLGARRDFQFRHKKSFRNTKEYRELETITMPLEHGSLLIMKHPTNQNWKHQLPKRARRTTDQSGRLNLTWRVMYSQNGTNKLTKGIGPERHKEQSLPCAWRISNLDEFPDNWMTRRYTFRRTR
ncbi:alpha-ketoglutarate-dependent dioxygenase AlkB [Gammaproteobacteria bacterium]|nr:alpha-ketoglutarate-dependent dioxygenase AlkB [Gammaproteobacteria bacterium]